VPLSKPLERDDAGFRTLYKRIQSDEELTVSLVDSSEGPGYINILSKGSPTLYSGIWPRILIRESRLAAQMSPEESAMSMTRNVPEGNLLQVSYHDR
jgi:hypothetical protein